MIDGPETSCGTGSERLEVGLPSLCINIGGAMVDVTNLGDALIAAGHALDKATNHKPKHNPNKIHTQRGVANRAGGSSSPSQ